MTKQEQTEQLVSEGFQLLEEKNLEKAIKVGKKLKKLRHSSAFEILALAYAEKDEKKRAITVLEEGVQKAPDVWFLWQLLGNYYSDEERFSEAHQAYQRALKCPEVNSASVELNIAIAFDRDEKPQDGLNVLEQIWTDDSEIQCRAQVTKVGLLNQIGKHEEAIELAEKVTETLPEDAPDDQVAALHAEHGVAIWEGRKDRAAALELAWKSIGFRKNESTALRLIREIEGEISGASHYFRIMIQGRWIWDTDEYSGPLGFFTTYDVTAESPEEALAFIRRFEPPEIHRSLRIEECERIEPRPDEPKGVYRVTGYIFFPLDNGGE